MELIVGILEKIEKEVIIISFKRQEINAIKSFSYDNRDFSYHYQLTPILSNNFYL